MKPVDSKEPSVAPLFFLMRRLVIKAVCYSVVLLPLGFTRHLDADTSSPHTAESLKLCRELIGYIIPEKKPNKTKPKKKKDSNETKVFFLELHRWKEFHKVAACTSK